jgi:chromosomal replication initiation ATPase DnaA
VTRQLILDLGAAPSFTRADFLPAPSNAEGLDAIADTRLWPGGKLVLSGPAGSGKTHLARIWAAETGAVVWSGAEFPDAAAAAPPPAAVIDGAGLLAGDAGRETALFHFWNRMQAERAPVLVTLRTPPQAAGFQLPDLVSRLHAARQAQLSLPDDAHLAAVIVKLFADRQVEVAPPLVHFLIARIERSIGAARAIVARLDRLALAEGRPVTRALAARLLDSGGPG